MSARLAGNARQEWATYWPLVITACVGFSFHSVTTYSLGLFIQPLSSEFGWSRAQVSAGLSIAAMLAIPVSPLVGWMIDKWGSRRLALPGLVATSLSIAAFSFASGSVTQWLALWTIYAIFSMGIKATMWTAAVSSVFSASRGLALAITLSGTPIAQILAPPLTRWLVDNHGWQAAYVWLGIGWGFPALVLSIFFLFDARDVHRKAEKTSGVVAKVELAGLTIGEAVRNWPLIRVAIASLIIMTLCIGVIVHQVPILTEAGVSRETAAYLASLAGFAGIFGKIITGHLMDRFHAGKISSLSIALAAVAFGLLLEPLRTPPLIVVAMVLIGYASGCKLQICTYLTSRYGGMRNFGTIFGVMNSLVAVGAGIGPVLAGAVHDTFGSYSPLIVAGIPASLVAALLLLGLGPYPHWDTPTQSAAGKAGVDT